MFDKVLHRVKSRAPPELVQKTVSVLEKLGDGSVSEKQLDEVAKNLATMKSTMFSAGDSEPSKEAAVTLTYEVRIILCSPPPPSHYSPAHAAIRGPPVRACAHGHGSATVDASRRFVGVVARAFGVSADRGQVPWCFSEPFD